MKACPHCGGEIRPSVIRCVHCGATLSEGPEVSAAVPFALAGATDPLPQPGAATVGRAPSVGAGPPADPWATPSLPSGRRPSVERASEPSRGASVAATTVRRMDIALAVSGVIAVGGAIVAYSSLSMPWVRAQVVTMGDRGAKVVADLTFQGADAMGGRAVLGVAAVLLVLGLLWFWYSLDLGATLPTVAHPLIALLAAAAAGVLLAFSRLGSLFWGDAFVARAREAGMSRDAMRQLLDARPAPLVDVGQLGGSYRFGIAAVLALAAATLAWWSQRRRD